MMEKEGKRRTALLFSQWQEELRRHCQFQIYNLNQTFLFFFPPELAFWGKYRIIWGIVKISPKRFKECPSSCLEPQRNM